MHEALGVCAVLLAVIALAGGFSRPPLNASTEPRPRNRGPSTPVVNLVKQVSPAVVNITAKGDTRAASWSERFGPSVARGVAQVLRGAAVLHAQPLRDAGGPFPAETKPLLWFRRDHRPEGLILTNHHVVSGRENMTITVTLSDDNEFEGEIIGTDEKTTSPYPHQRRLRPADGAAGGFRRSGDR